MKLHRFKINSRFKNIADFELNFLNKEGITVLIGNNGSGKSNILEAISSVFSGLYNHKYNPSFNYELSYTTRDLYKIDVTFEDGTYSFTINDKKSSIKSDFLPTQLISSYSGEESRLWKKYYEPFYQEYIDAIKGSTLPNSKLVYINKYYWNIALLTLHFYDFASFTDIREFCQDTLGISSLNFIKFSFNIQKLKDWSKNPNPVTNFVSAINPNQEEQIQITLLELKDKLSYIISNEIDFFRYLSASFMPKNDKLITNIELNINANLWADCLSEGEKKLLLIKFILEVVGDQDSLILLDEPDSHIHVSRKEEIHKLLYQYSNRENIITTHSPTLTHDFDKKHIIMLTKNEKNDAQIEDKEKQDIIYELTKGIWSYQEQNIFLNSNNDILLVEGKSDETFLKKALEVLQKTEPRYANLKFEYLPCGGADGVKLMVQKFKPKIGQHIIAFFDSDKAGWESINSIFGKSDKSKFDNRKFNRYQKKENIWIAHYPIRPYYRGGQNFNVEDYFSKALLTKHVLQSFKGLDSFITKKSLKVSLERGCENFNDYEFKHFKVVFDLILEIKAQN